MDDGQITIANTVHHIRAHRGDESLFFDPDNLESICETHHNATKQREESRGCVIGVDATGWPIDPDHHWNSSTPGGRSKKIG
jgi:5-methylcytosine-specific restriction enzyme A